MELLQSCTKPSIYGPNWWFIGCLLWGFWGKLSNEASAYRACQLAAIHEDIASWYPLIFDNSLVNYVIIGSNNGLSPSRHQAIIWFSAAILSIRPLGTNFSEISIEIHTFSFKKMRLKVSSAKWRPCCPGLNVLSHCNPWRLVGH